MGGHIQKTGGRWRIDYRDGQGRRHRATFDTRKEADNALTDIKSRIGKRRYLASKLLPKSREFAKSRKTASLRRAIVVRERWQLACPDRSPLESEIGRPASRSERRRAHRGSMRKPAKNLYADEFLRRSLSWARVKKDNGPVRWRFYPPKTKTVIRTLLAECTRLILYRRFCQIRSHHRTLVNQGFFRF